MSDDYRGRHRAPAGRHRAHRADAVRPLAPRTGSHLPRLAHGKTSGLLLPTAAAATLALTAAGGHLAANALGASSAAAQSSPQAAISGVTVASGATATPTEDAIDRPSANGVARDSTRGATDALPESSATTADQQEPQGPQEQTEAQAKAEADAAAVAAADAQTRAQAKAAGDAAAADADSKAKTAAGHSWVAPLDGGYNLTSGFAMRWGTMHPGQDFAVPIGTPVHALSTGTVIFAGWSGGYGNKVEIQYWDGTVSWFAHNSQLLVIVGQPVTPGQTVSMSGNTGHSTGPHVHVEIHPGNGAAVSPLPWLSVKGINA